MKILSQILVLILAIFLWQISSGELVPSPKDSLLALSELYENGGLLNDISSSLYNYFLGLFIGLFFAISLGIFFGLCPKILSAFAPLFGFLKPISPIAYTPLIIILFGIGSKPTIFIIAYAIFFPLLQLSVSAILKTPTELINIAKGFGASKAQIIAYVIVPNSIFSIISGIKIAASLAWINLVIGEMLGSQSGLGYLIIDARNQLRLDMVLGVILVIGAIGVIINFVFKLFEKSVSKRFGL